MSSPRMACYRYYDDSATVIYVGITGSLSKRHQVHMREAVWAPQVRSLAVEWFDRPELAEHREQVLIDQYKPEYNIEHKRKSKDVTYPDFSEGVN